jgi:hypothetical protein
MRALAGMSLALLAFVFLGALDFGACMFVDPALAAVAFRFDLTASWGFRSDAS